MRLRVLLGSWTTPGQDVATRGQLLLFGDYSGTMEKDDVHRVAERVAHSSRVAVEEVSRD